MYSGSTHCLLCGNAFTAAYDHSNCYGVGYIGTFSPGGPGGGSGGSVATVIRGTEDYKEKKKHLVKYLLMKVVEEDWH